MIVKKYVNDYTVDILLTPKGKWKDIAVYTGPLYQLNLNEKELEKFKKSQIVLNIIGWCLFFLPLLVYSSATRTSYIVLPYMLLFLVCFYQSTAVCRLSILKLPCKREEKDKVEDRLKGTAIFGIILCITTLILCIYYIIRLNQYFSMGNVLFICSDVSLMISFIINYRLTKKLIFSEYLPQK